MRHKIALLFSDKQKYEIPKDQYDELCLDEKIPMHEIALLLGEVLDEYDFYANEVDESVRLFILIQTDDSKEVSLLPPVEVVDSEQVSKVASIVKRRLSRMQSGLVPQCPIQRTESANTE